MATLVLVAACDALDATSSSGMDNETMVNETVRAYLTSAQRPAADAEQDEGRKPAQVLAFAGVQPGTRVLDVLGGGGYYAELLSVAVGHEGRVTVHNSDYFMNISEGAVGRAVRERAERLANLDLLVSELSDVQAEQPYDLVFLGLVLHDIVIFAKEEGAVQALNKLGSLLKPGGVLVVIDHNGSPDQDNAKLHRMPQAQAERVLKLAGFSITEESKLLRNPDDGLDKLVFIPGLRRHTDRFLFKATPGAAQ